MKKILLVIMVMVAFSNMIKAQLIASDYADNGVYSSWDNGDNGGTGFDGWILSQTGTTGYAGHFIGNAESQGFSPSINTSNKAFGMYGNGGDKYSNSKRLFSSNLAQGNTIKISIAIAYRATGNKGIDLLNSNEQSVFTFNAQGDVYKVNNVSLGWGYSQTSLFIIEATQDDGKFYVKITRGTDVYGPTEFTSALPLKGFNLFCGETASGDLNNLYFNSMEIRNDSPVPVELSSFTAAIQNKAVVLNWATATEINNYGFEVERSFDKTNWNTLAFKNGYGNSNSVKDYTYTDKDITKNGMYYYRLKQIDNNGDFEYSNIVEVSVNMPIKFEVSQNYPNPFNPVTNISFNLPEASNVTFYIFNAIGQQIKAINAGYKEAGKHTLEFDGSNLNSGVYFYKVEAGNNSMIRKMALIK